MSPTGPFLQLLPIYLLGLFPVTPTIHSQPQPSTKLIKRLRIGDNCDGPYVCDSNDYLLICPRDSKYKECACDEKWSIQVDFLKYRVGRMCLLREDVPCDRMKNFTSNFNLNIQRIPEILLRFLRNETITQNDTKVIMIEEMKEIEKEINALYDKEPIDSRPSREIYSERHLNNYTRDTKEYQQLQGLGTSCSSGECQDDKCTIGVNIRHEITGQRRKFRNGVPAPQIMSFKIHISFILLLFLPASCEI